MKTTKEFFDSRADNWDEVNTYDNPPEAFKGIVALLGIANGSSVVDLGCGTGVLIPYLLNAAGSSGTIYAIDISEKMISNLRKKYDADNIIPLICPSDDLGISDNTIDAVICFSAFPHFESGDKSIEEIARILKPGGRFLIAHFSNREEINVFHSQLEYPICHHYLPSADELNELFNKNGFNIGHYNNEEERYELLVIKGKTEVDDFSHD